MNSQSIIVLTSIITVAALLFSIIYTAGVVWRVEKELDISYKFFLTGIVFVSASEILDLLFSPGNNTSMFLTIKVLRMLFAVCFLIGILLMRDIVRKLDGEKPKK